MTIDSQCYIFKYLYSNFFMRNFYFSNRLNEKSYFQIIFPYHKFLKTNRSKPIFKKIIDKIRSKLFPINKSYLKNTSIDHREMSPHRKKNSNKLSRVDRATLINPSENKNERPR